MKPLMVASPNRRHLGGPRNHRITRIPRRTGDAQIIAASSGSSTERSRFYCLNFKSRNRAIAGGDILLVEACDCGNPRHKRDVGVVRGRTIHKFKVVTRRHRIRTLQCLRRTCRAVPFQFKSKLKRLLELKGVRASEGQCAMYR